MANNSSAPFHLKFGRPTLIRPASSTPAQVNEVPLRCFENHSSFLFFYNHHPLMEGEDPVAVIRHATAKALLHFYPFSGRIQRASMAEGVLFAEADAFLTMEDLREHVHPPRACTKDFSRDFCSASGVLAQPLLQIQITRLLCGGFVLGIRWSDTVADEGAMFEFMNAVAELSKGKNIDGCRLPIWRSNRHDAGYRKGDGGIGNTRIADQNLRGLAILKGGGDGMAVISTIKRFQGIDFGWGEAEYGGVGCPFSEAAAIAIEIPVGSMSTSKRKLCSIAIFFEDDSFKAASTSIVSRPRPRI